MYSWGRTPELLDTTPLVLGEDRGSGYRSSIAIRRNSGGASVPDQLVEMELPQTSQLLHQGQLADTNLEKIM